jgi:hypothetical protein
MSEDKQKLPPQKLLYEQFINMEVRWTVPGTGETFTGTVISVRYCLHLKKDVALVRLNEQLSEIVDCDQLLPVKTFYASYSEKQRARSGALSVELVDGRVVQCTEVNVQPNKNHWDDAEELGLLKFYITASYRQ